MNNENDGKGSYGAVDESTAPPPVPEAVAVAVLEPERVQVRAPMDLSGGYELVVEGLNDQGGGTWIVRVPDGGVRKGELFSGDVISKTKVSGQTIVSTTEINPHHIPTGHWRDGICSCCVQGCCHQVLCLSFWCLPLALGQVMTRMKLGILGDQATTNDNSTRTGNALSPFKFLLLLLVVYLIILEICKAIIQPYMEMDDTTEIDDDFFESIDISYHLSSDAPGWIWFVWAFRIVIQWVFYLFVLYLMVKTRSYVRSTYEIPERFCHGCEDCCCGFWCGCCTVSQMARHTADYHTYQASCCSDTGFNGRTPPTLPPANVNAHVV